MNIVFLLSLEQLGKRITMDQGGKLDIYIAVDASDSIDVKDFINSKNTIKMLIEKVCHLSNPQRFCEVASPHI